MAASACRAAVAAPAGLGASLKARTTRPQLKSAFACGTGASFKGVQLRRVEDVSRVTCFQANWLRKDLTALGFGLIGWITPASIPAINGESLTSLFFKSIGPELAHFPSGPAVDSPFWLWLVTWHLGLFISLTFAQIGLQARKEGGYF